MALAKSYGIRAGWPKGPGQVVGGSGGVTPPVPPVTARSLLNASMLAAGALAHWPMNETSGSTLADVINGYDLSATAVTLDQPNLPLSNGASFNGTTSNAARPGDDAGLAFEYNTPKTIEGVINPNITRSGATTQYALLAKRFPTGTAVGWEAYLQWNSSLTITQLVFGMSNPTTGYRVEQQTVDFANGAPQHIMMTHTGSIDAASRVTIFVDGKQLALGSLTASWGSPANPSILTAAPVTAGARRSGATVNHSLAGVENDMAMYASVRPQDEAIYRASLVRNNVPWASAATPARYVMLMSDAYADCDDIVGLALAVACHKAGTSTIIAGICDSPGQYGAAFIDTVFKINGLSIPVGAYQGSIGPGSSDTPSTSTAWRTTSLAFSGYNLGARANYPDHVGVMRQALAAIPDGAKCVPFALGTANSLEALRLSAADGYSPLSGSDLMAAKIDYIEFVGGGYTGTGIGASASYNFAQSPAAAASFIANSPVPIIFQGDDVGGGKASLGGDLVNPVLTQPQVQNTGTSPCWNNWQNAAWNALRPTGFRQSYDPMAVYAACVGETAGQLQEIGIGGNNVINSSNGDNVWSVATGGKHYFQRRLNNTGVAAAVAADIQARIAGVL